MSAEIFDIVTCPACAGEKTVDGGQMMKDAKIYSVRRPCPLCKGEGRVGVVRQEGECTHD